MKKFLWVKWFLKRILSFPLKLDPQSRSGIRILTYHHINDEIDTEFSVTTRRFVEQMVFLTHNAKVISLEEAVKLLKNKEKIQGEYTVLTFDDGYEDFYHNAFPVLSRFSLPATMFLPVGYVDTVKDSLREKHLAYSRVLKLEQITEMQQCGLIDFQSHATNHYKLNTVGGEILDTEISGSKHLLTSLLGHKIKYFAYPYGIYSQEAVDLVAQNYEAALSTLIGTNNIETNLYLLKRIQVDRSDDLELFKLKISGKFDVFYKLQRFYPFSWLWDKLTIMLTN